MICEYCEEEHPDDFAEPIIEEMPGRKIIFCPTKMTVIDDKGPRTYKGRKVGDVLDDGLLE